MTVASLVLGFLAAIVCSVAARRVAETKGRTASNWAVGGFLLGPIALLVLAFIGPGGEQAGQDRLAWWSESAIARTWAGLAMLVAAGSIVVTVLAVTREMATARRLDGAALASSLEFDVAQKLHQETGDVINLHVTCPPDPPMKRAYIFDCDVAGWPDNAATHLRISEDDDQGHYHYEAY